MTQRPPAPAYLSSILTNTEGLDKMAMSDVLSHGYAMTHVEVGKGGRVTFPVPTHLRDFIEPNFKQFNLEVPGLETVPDMHDTQALIVWLKPSFYNPEGVERDAALTDMGNRAEVMANRLAAKHNLPIIPYLYCSDNIASTPTPSAVILITDKEHVQTLQSAVKNDIAAAIRTGLRGAPGEADLY